MSFSAQYSGFDKAVHRLAFGPRYLREVLQDMESSLFGRQWANTPIVKPVFVASLPRAGTTILLECLAADPALVSHTYRDMPFVYSPVLWRKLSSAFYKSRKKSERAHGDGLMVNEDSPEAFEEVFWLDLNPTVYAADSIALSERVDDSAVAEFRDQIRKLLFLYGGEGTPARYLSKNNANIARIPVLKSAFADALIVIPFRDPLEHAYSMWRQHLRFAEMHAVDSFVLTYMRDLGHFEFGALHKPVLFPNLREITAAYATGDFNYWLAYWVSAFEYLIDQPELIFVSYENLCVGGREGIDRLRDRLGLARNAELAESMAARLRVQQEKNHLESEIARDLAERAAALHRALGDRCLLVR